VPGDVIESDAFNFVLLVSNPTGVVTTNPILVAATSSVSLYLPVTLALNLKLMSHSKYLDYIWIMAIRRRQFALRLLIV
jgi:hypothetical protein